MGFELKVAEGLKTESSKHLLAGLEAEKKAIFLSLTTFLNKNTKFRNPRRWESWDTETRPLVYASLS